MTTQPHPYYLRAGVNNVALTTARADADRCFRRSRRRSGVTVWLVLSLVLTTLLGALG